MKKRLLRLWSEYDTYLNALLKFMAAIVSLLYLCRTGGTVEPFGQLPVLLMVAAACSFLPKNALILIGAVYLTGQLYLCSLEAAIVGGIVLLILLLVYFSFLPGQTYVVVLTMLCVSWKIPFAVPLACALLCGSGAAAGIILGCAALAFHSQLRMETAASDVFGEAFFNHIVEMFRRLPAQRNLILQLVVLMAVFLVVYLIRRLPVRYSWHIAILSGTAAYGLLTGMCSLLPGIPFSAVWFLVDLGIGMAVGFLLLYFCFSLDYKKVEHLQFEDDEYYYYVRAVPKRKAAKPDEDEEGDFIE